MVIRDTIKAKRHPTGPGSTGSWRGDAKAKIPIVGKRNVPDYAEQARNHQSAPLQTLKDPDSFGPPPKHIHYHGAVASPSTTTPDPRGWGAPLPKEQVRAITQGNERRQAQEAEPPKPSGPYRVDTTGLSTAGLPKPPTHRALLESNEQEDTGLWKAPPGASSKPQTRPAPRHSVPQTRPTTQPQPQSKPQPPPRLPPRQNSRPNVNTPDPPPAYKAISDAQSKPTEQGYLNSKSVNHLGQAGISVPGFGIGQPPSGSTSISENSENTSQVSELQSRFARMNASSAGNSPQLQSTTTSVKKAPPPPPKKKTLAENMQEHEDTPPPIPLSSKPTF